MVNFGPLETVPGRFRDRNLYGHNPTVTLMRTTAEECAELGRRVARKLNAASGPVALYIPLKGISAIDVEGGVFYDPEADEALFSTVKATIGPNVDLHEMDMDINDPRFARAIADHLHHLIGARAA
jgi:uncharacterized protein (UPF0261 family)